MRVLFVEPRILTPERDGGSYRKWRILRALLELGFEVSLLPEFPNAWPPFDRTMAEDLQALEALGVTIIHETLREHLTQARNRRRYEVIVFTTVRVASKHLEWTKGLETGATIVFDTVDLHYLREYREAKVTKNMHHIRNSLRTKQMELACVMAADAVWVVSETEKDTLRQDCPTASISVVPNVHETMAVSTSFDAREGIFFLGSYTFSPNVYAVKAFVTDVFPLLQKVLPNLHFYIVGSDPTQEVSALESPNVHVTGYESDLTTFLSRRRVCVAPLEFGAGIKGKILLSMGLGVPVVTSPVGAEGIPGEHGKHWFVAKTKEDWVTHVKDAYEDRQVWSTLSRQGSCLVEENYGYQRMKEKLKHLFNLDKKELRRA